MGARPLRSRIGLAREEKSQRRNREHRSNDREGVAERQDQRLMLHDLSDRHDRLVLSRDGVSL